MRMLSLALGLAFITSSAFAAPTVDGVLSSGEYGAAVAVQGVQTGFGDNISELDAAYGRVSGGMLYVMLTGNLENNFNKLNIFIDSKTGGQNQIVGGSNPGNDGWAAAHNGMQFDAGFEPDYLLILRNGTFGGARFDFDYAVVGGGATSFDSHTDIFGGSTQGAGSTPVGPNLGFSFMVGFNNSNVAGVLGGAPAAADPTAALAVTTGIELGIPLAALGNPANGDLIRVSAMVNGGNHGYLSNQFLGSLRAPQGNLGGDGLGNFVAPGLLAGINLNNFPGEQFFTVVVPEPGSLALLGLGLLGVARARRRKS